METVRQNRSIVLVDNGINPSLLNPDFLKLHKIVPSDFEVNESITTPVLALCRFSNGINFQITPNSLILQHFVWGEQEIEFSFRDAVMLLVKHLHLNNVTAVGINFVDSILVEESNSEIIDRYIREELVNDELFSATVKLTYNTSDDSLLNIDIVPEILSYGEILDQQALTFKANYHLELSKESDFNLPEYISSENKKDMHFQEVVRTIYNGVK